MTLKELCNLVITEGGGLKFKYPDGKATLWFHADRLARVCLKMQAALELIEEKTKTDPAEGPELRARASVCYQAAKQALAEVEKILGGEA